MRVTFEIELPDPLARELQSACRECGISSKLFAAQSVESVLAGSRLPGVQVGRCVPRVAEDREGI